MACEIDGQALGVGFFWHPIYLEVASSDSGWLFKGTHNGHSMQDGQRDGQQEACYP